MIVVLSSPVPVADELQIIHQLFEEGLDFFQVYKPDFAAAEIEKFIQRISSRYHGRISLHESHLKFHSLDELKACHENFEYAFLSPVFDSISKAGYQGKYNIDELKVSLKKMNKRIIALGGIDEDKIDPVKEAGFAGIALVGAIWQSEKPVDKFKKIRTKWLAKEFPY